MNYRKYLVNYFVSNGINVSWLHLQIKAIV